VKAKAGAVVSCRLSVFRLASLATDNGELTTVSFTNAYVAALMFTRPTSPADPMRLAVFTVSPRMSYWNFFTPTMAADERVSLEHRDDEPMRCPGTT
jgi:hypothetical protein